MRKSAFCVTLVFFCMMALAGCKGGEGSVDSRLVDTFVEIRVSDQMYGSQSPAAGLARQEILKKHGYTRESFLAELDEIDQDRRLWLPFQKRVVDVLDSTLDPEGYIARKEEERKQAKAAKSKGKDK